MKTTQKFLDRADKYIKLEDTIANEGKPTPDSKKNQEKTSNRASENGANGSKNGNKNNGKRSHADVSISDNKRPKSNRYESTFINYIHL